MTKRIQRWTQGVGGAVLAAGLLAAGAASADSCREWRDEHRQWKVEVIRSYLNGAPQRELDAAVFELLQREAYLTSCETSVRIGRDELVGWRLVERPVEEYAGAVVESVLARSGYDVGLTEMLAEASPRLASASRSGGSRFSGSRRGVRSR